MRLRRSDFALWDYQKQARWHALQHLLWCANVWEQRVDFERELAWWLQRGNTRGLRALRQRVPWVAWLCALGVLSTQAQHPMAYAQRGALRRCLVVIDADEHACLRMVARHKGDEPCA